MHEFWATSSKNATSRFHRQMQLQKKDDSTMIRAWSEQENDTPQPARSRKLEIPLLRRSLRGKNTHFTLRQSSQVLYSQLLWLSATRTLSYSTLRYSQVLSATLTLSYPTLSYSYSQLVLLSATLTLSYSDSPLLWLSATLTLSYSYSLTLSYSSSQLLFLSPTLTLSYSTLSYSTLSHSTVSYSYSQLLYCVCEQKFVYR